MYKKLGIVSLSSDVGKYYKKELASIFANNVKISSYSFENNDLDREENIEELKNLDIILVSTYSQYEILKKYLGGDFNMLITRLTLSKKGHKILQSLKNTKSAM